MKSYVFGIYLFLILLIISCAQVVIPSGGPKDTTPPKPIKSYPEWGSTNFNDQKVILQFNEFVELDNPIQNISISPFYNGKIKTKIIGKNVLLYFDEKLNLNKTYILSFNKAIKDFKADNFLSYYEHRFSTGSKIDSGNLKISHYYSDNGRSVENATVVLVPSHQDFDSSRFLYYTTTAEGVSKMNNLDSNLYFPFGFIDSNFNKKWDKNEFLSFYNQKVSVKDTGIILQYFKEKPDSIIFDFKLLSSHLVSIEFNYEADVIRIEDHKNYDLIKLSKNKFFIYSKQPLKSYLEFYLDDNKYLISLPKDKTLDSFKVNLLNVNKPDKRQLETKVLDTLSLLFNSKITHIVDSNIIFSFDTIFDKNIKYHFINNRILFYNFNSNKNYKLKFLKDAVYSNRFKNDSFDYTFSTLSDSSFFDTIQITFKFKDTSSNYYYKIIEIDNNSFVKIKNNDVVTLKKIYLSSLHFHIFRDENNDGQREKGSYKERKIPEKSIFKDLVLDKKQKTYTIEF